MKKILLIAENFYPEEFGINDLVFELKSRGHDVIVLTQTPSYPFDKAFAGYKNKIFQSEVVKGIKVYRIFSLMMRKKSVVPKTLSYLVFAFLASFFIFFTKHNNYDKIFVYQVGPLTQMVPALVLKKIFKKKKIYLWVLDLWPDTVWGYGIKKNKFTNWILVKFCRICYNSCEKIFVSNPGFEKKIKEISNISKIFFTPQWIPKAIIYKKSEKVKFDKSATNFLFAGNIGKVQNLEIIVQSFKKFEGKCNFHLVGDGSNLKSLKNLVKFNKINNVYFHGKKPLDEVGSWLVEADILVISLIDKLSFNLTVPAKFQAYLGAKKPIFSVMKGETSNMINNYSLGLSSDPNSSEDIENKIESFLSISKDELNGYSKNCDKLLSEFYDFNKLIKVFQDQIN